MMDDVESLLVLLNMVLGFLNLGWGLNDLFERSRWSILNFFSCGFSFAAVIIIAS